MSQDFKPPIRSLRCMQAVTDMSHFCGVWFGFSLSLAFLSSCLSQKAALRGTLVPPRTPPVPLIVTDLFFRVKKSSAHFLIHFAPLSSPATVEAIEADEGKLASPLSVVPATDKGSAGCIHFFSYFDFYLFFLICCSLYRVCGCWANSCGSVLTEMFLL